MAKAVSRQRWIKFYPAEYESDPAVRVCCLAAQGLWIRMLCLMHRGTPAGHLTVNARPLTAEMLAAIVGVPAGEVGLLLEELCSNGVFSETADGVIFSRRIVADAKAYAEAVKNGRAGGNPQITKKKSVKLKRVGVNPHVNHEDNRRNNEGVILESERESDSFSASQNAPSMKARSDQAFRLPPDWQPSTADGTYAERLGLNVARVTEDFRGYWLAKGGKEARKMNWSLTWQGWCRRAADNLPKRAIPAAPGDPRNMMASFI